VIGRYEAEWDRLAAGARQTGIPRAPDPAQPYGLGPRAIFSHYPSHTLAADCRLEATSAALDEASYNESSVVLRPDLLRALLNRAGGGATLEEIVGSVDAPEGHAAYGATWLLKYGLLRLTDSRSHLPVRLPA
jgi:hypothetical protein